MTRRTGPWIALLVAAWTPAAAHFDPPQNPPRDRRKTAAEAPAAPVGTAAIRGTVTTEDGTTPIRFAHMLLLGASTGVVKVSSTDAGGRFAFTGLPADRYTVAASKSPYLGAIAGAKRPARPGTPIAVADGQSIPDVTIRMQMGGSISGVVTDERGETGSATSVSLQQWRVQGGVRTLVAVPWGAALTDDRGRYRFFGLPPGEYVVSATKYGSPFAATALSAADVDAALRGAAPAAPALRPASPVRYAPVFYPGTTRTAEAATIAVDAGEDRTGIDFRLEITQTSRVEGTVTSHDRQPIGNATVRIMSGAQTMNLARSRPDGTFTAAGLVPGAYSLQAIGAGAYAGQYAHAAVEIAGLDVAGVQLVMRPAMSIAGRLVFEGAGPAPALAGRFVPVQRVETPAEPVANAIAPQPSMTDRAGAFTISNVTPGRYLIGGPMSFGPTKETMTWTLQSVVADGRDVTDLPIEISADSPPRTVVVTYGNRHQEVSGRLRSQSGAPVSDHTIVVFPEDRAYWSFRSRRIATARPGTDGRFTLSGPGPTTLPPGRYLIAAVTDIGPDEQFDPAFLAQLVPAAVPVALGLGEKKVQELAIR